MLNNLKKKGNVFHLKHAITHSLTFMNTYVHKQRLPFCAGTVDGRDKEAALGLAADGRHRAALVPHALQGRTGVDAEGHQL